ncbi:SRPBCC family protein [Aquihabitans sp. McL0605]|uniref:SRPBCC family protein n=1 Tax=Aquihabitans sp. McL0605 TaxID=3415671 RepID=UPI003CEF8F59
MTTVRRSFDHPIDDVFAAVADPRTYPHWLVGAKAMRAVDPTWPAPGSSFHHRVGLVGPLTLDDSSSSKEVHAPNLLVLEVRARPIGRAEVRFEVTEPGGGVTEVAFSEEPIGPARLFTFIAAPLAVIRNRRSLDHLERYLADPSAEGR